MKQSPLAALAVFLLASLPAHAGAADDAVAAIGKCASLNDNTARLVCYDKIAGRSTTVEVAPQAQPQTAPPVQTAAAAQPPSKEEEESWFGIADWFGSDKASPSAQATPQQFGSEKIFRRRRPLPARRRRSSRSTTSSPPFRISPTPPSAASSSSSTTAKSGSS